MVWYSMVLQWVVQLHYAPALSCTMRHLTPQRPSSSQLISFQSTNCFSHASSHPSQAILYTSRATHNAQHSTPITSHHTVTYPTNHKPQEPTGKPAGDLAQRLGVAGQNSCGGGRPHTSGFSTTTTTTELRISHTASYQLYTILNIISLKLFILCEMYIRY